MGVIRNLEESQKSPHMLPGKSGSTVDILGLITRYQQKLGCGEKQQTPTEAPGQANCKYPCCLEGGRQIKQEAARIMLLEVNTAWGSVT